MEATWGWQYVDFYPDEIREQGRVSEAEALAAFAAFPWEAQLQKLSQRQREGRTSTLPGVWFRRGSEYLLLTSPDDLTVLLDYRVGEKHYPGRVSLNWHAHTLDPEDIIQMFFAGTLPAWPGWNYMEPYVPLAPPPTILSYTSRSRSPWSALLPPAGVVVLALVLAVVTPLQVSILLGGTLVGLLLFGPAARLNWQYLQGGGQQVEVDVVHHQLTLHDRHGTLEFGREQVRDCVVVRTRPRSRSFQGYQYVCFVLTNHQVCVITHHTGPSVAIAEAMGVQYRVEEPGFPSIYFRRLSDAELEVAEQEHQQRILEFERRFASYTDAQLGAIVSEPERYASHAVAAAGQLLQSRTITKA
ncbi:hypothetical protein [Hymenobacter lucidus]|uniref:PH domain-containing protein n=1 Tax=Hymenobacter lucidus TaxID=2880930 RepID=A0ABS8ATB6_9BACT|nr:hypothetical protein [Hymenobacter lucidus]MCB2408601.1 hypothetical protein [Hymenobacter lucidus]